MDSEVALRSTAAVQLALLISGVAFGRALLAEGAAPTMVGGLSVGAFAAAVIADALDFSLALPLVRLRGELMENMYPSGYGMAAIMGLAEQQIRDLIADVTSPDSPVFLGSLNAPRQIVVSGVCLDWNDSWRRRDSQAPVGTQQLNVSVPSHCRLSEPVAEELDCAAGYFFVPFSQMRLHREPGWYTAS